MLDLNERLLLDYLIDNEYNTFPDFSIKNIQSNNGSVRFNEYNVGYEYDYIEHDIELLDIMSWLYNKLIKMN
jgi:hypothetical protein